MKSTDKIKPEWIYGLLIIQELIDKGYITTGEWDIQKEDCYAAISLKQLEDNYEHPTRKRATEAAFLLLKQMGVEKDSEGPIKILIDNVETDLVFADDEI